MNRSISFAAVLLFIWISGYLLIVGRGLLVPFIIAIFVWHLLNTMIRALEKIPVIGKRIPYWIRLILSILIAMILVRTLIDIIANNVNEVIAASPRYQDNLLNIFNNLDARFHIKVMTYFDSLIKNLNVQKMVVNFYSIFTGITSSAVLIVLYVTFLFVEQHYFFQKINAMTKQENHRNLVNNIITHIARDTQTYLGLKSLMSLLTATSSWIIMKSVGLDFAEFWALLIFFLNYIPNIGSIIATLFPAMLALIQFPGWLPFFEVALGIISVQFVVGNVIEPRFLGKSLNLSPLIMLIALAIWGAMWGIMGMFLAVPITVMMMIIFAHFESTRPIAIMLSQDGHIQPVYEQLEG